MIIKWFTSGSRRPFFPLSDHFSLLFHYIVKYIFIYIFICKLASIECLRSANLLFSVLYIISINPRANQLGYK